MLGLTLALRLAQRGYRVTLLEAADHLGGLADAWQLGDVTWDRHYHVTLLSDSHLRGLLRELGLDDEMHWVQTRTGFLVDGRLHSLSNTLEFLRFPPLGLIDKLRLGWTILHASRVRDWRTLEQIPVADWLVRHSGRRTFEQIWLPLLKAKLGEPGSGRARRSSGRRFSGCTPPAAAALKNEMFGYLPAAMRECWRRFRQRLEDAGRRDSHGLPREQTFERDDGRHRSRSTSSGHERSALRPRRRDDAGAGGGATVPAIDSRRDAAAARRRVSRHRLRVAAPAASRWRATTSRTSPTRRRSPASSR